MNIFSQIASPLIFIWNTILFNPIINIFVFFYKISGSNLGLAIIIITVLLRLLLWPLLKSQLQSSRNMQKMQPKLASINKKYAGDVVKLREEQMKIFKEEGVNPLGSCLSLLVQLPILWGVYEAIIVMSNHTAAYLNKIMYFSFLKYPALYHYNLSFLNINMGKDAMEIGIFSVGALSYIILSLLVAFSQYLVSKVSLPQTTNEIIEEKTELELQSKDKKALDVDPAQFGNIMSKQILYVMPVLLLLISLGILGPIPAALSLYWAVQSIVIYLQTILFMKK